MALYVDDRAQLRILVPARTPNSVVTALLEERRPWIEKNILKQQERKSRHAESVFRDGMQLPFLGRAITLSLCSNGVCVDAARAKKAILENDTLHMPLRFQKLSAEAAAQQLRADIRKWYQKTAQGYIAQRLEFWSERLRIPYRTFELSNARRLWGSCTHDNVIRINWRIIMAAPQVMDYLLIHELCHVRHKNHSCAFWRAVEAALPDAMMRRRELKTTAQAFLAYFRY